MQFAVCRLVGWVEDSRFISGGGRCTYDVDASAGLRVAFLRAPYAHERLEPLDYSAVCDAFGIQHVDTPVTS